MRMFKLSAALAVLSVLPAAAMAAVPFPPAGTVETFACTGIDFDGTTTTWGETVEGVVSYTVARSTGETQARKMATWMRGTSMNLERPADGGIRKMELDYGSFEGLDSLTPGSYEGWVYETRPGKKRIHWHYSVTVKAPEKKAVDDLGEVDVVVVQEKRDVSSYFAEQTWELDAATGLTLRTTYTDNRGENVECARAP